MPFSMSVEKEPQVQIFMEDESPAAPAEIQFEELNIIFRMSAQFCSVEMFRSQSDLEDFMLSVKLTMLQSGILLYVI